MLDRLETTLRVRGGARLEGSVATHGAKNAALPIMAAALLAKGKVTLHRVPRITDVSVMWSLLEALGARLRYEGNNTITIDSSNVASYRAPYALVRKLAASFDIVGPLLGRFGRAEVPLPGGCVLGTRATDMHEQAFVALGCEVRNAHGYLIAESKRTRLQGATIEFRMPSVGATKNAMLAAVLAEGTTTIKNAAMEPEVTDLANFLVAMGAKIAGLGTDTHRRSTASKNCTASNTRSFPIASSPERCCSPAPSRAATSRLPAAIPSISRVLAKLARVRRRSHVPATIGFA